jgi:glycosyltransferase involved in cell wall biosynthesis
MKLSVQMIVLNEADFVEACLDGIYPYAHDISIVDGSVPYTRWIGWTNEQGGSLDDSAAIIQNYINTKDVNNKIKFQTNVAASSKIELRNTAIEPLTGDWILLLDSDEFYTKHDMDTILTRLAALPSGTLGITYPFKQFWTWNLYGQGIVMERMYRNTPSTIYQGDPKEGQNIYIEGKKLWGSGRTKHYDDVFCYHYSPFLVNSALFEKFRQKNLYYGARALGITNQYDFIEKTPNVESAAKKEMTRLIMLMLDTNECSTQDHPESFKKSKLYQSHFILGGENG